MAKSIELVAILLIAASYCYHYYYYGDTERFLRDCDIVAKYSIIKNIGLHNYQFTYPWYIYQIIIINFCHWNLAKLPIEYTRMRNVQEPAYILTDEVFGTIAFVIAARASATDAFNLALVCHIQAKYL